MSNTFKTLSDGDIVRKSLASFTNKLKFIKTINRQYDDRFGVEGAKNGGTLLVRDPVQFEVTDGAVMTAQDRTETTQTITVATQRHVGMNCTSAEATLSIDDGVERYIDPAMDRLAASVEATVLSGAMNAIWNQTGTPATTPATLGAITNANARLTYGLAPESNRNCLLDPDAMAATTGSMAGYFRKASEIDRAFSEGLVGHAARMNWYESAMVPSHTNGTRTDTTPVTTIGGTTSVPTGGIVNASATITMTAFADGTTYTVGDIFTIADVYAVNMETKERYNYLQQFTVTTAETETGSGDMTPDVTPTPQSSGATQNIDIASTGAKAIVNLTGGGSGAASLVTAQNLAYHRDFCTFVSADLNIEKGENMAKAMIDNISMRYWRGSDITNDKFPERIDVLFGYKVLRPEWAVRVRG